MSRQFRDLMNGLDEVEAFLAGERTGYKVTLPAKPRLKMLGEARDMSDNLSESE